MRSRVDDLIRLEPEQTLSNILSSLGARCACADKAASICPQAKATEKSNGNGTWESRFFQFGAGESQGAGRRVTAADA